MSRQHSIFSSWFCRGNIDGVLLPGQIPSTLTVTPIQHVVAAPLVQGGGYNAVTATSEGEDPPDDRILLTRQLTGLHDYEVPPGLTQEIIEAHTDSTDLFEFMPLFPPAPPPTPVSQSAREVAADGAQLVAATGETLHNGMLVFDQEFLASNTVVITIGVGVPDTTVFALDPYTGVYTVNPHALLGVTHINLGHHSLLENVATANMTISGEDDTAVDTAATEETAVITAPLEGPPTLQEVTPINLALPPLLESTAPASMAISGEDDTAVATAATEETAIITAPVEGHLTPVSPGYSDYETANDWIPAANSDITAAHLMQAAAGMSAAVTGSPVAAEAPFGTPLGFGESFPAVPGHFPTGNNNLPLPAMPDPATIIGDQYNPTAQHHRVWVALILAFAVVTYFIYHFSTFEFGLIGKDSHQDHKDNGGEL